MEKLFLSEEREGLSLRFIYRVIAIIAILLSTILIVETFFVASSFNSLKENTERYISWQHDAYEMMNASDYLTHEVQRFTVNGDVTHMNNYFYEAEVAKRREKAISDLPEDIVETEVFKQMKVALNESYDLMNTEYYAMALVLDSIHFDHNSYPEALKSIKLKDEDKNLSDFEKRELAQDLVHSDEYNTTKEVIGANLNRCVDEIDEYISASQNKSINETNTLITVVRINIVFQSLVIIFILWITSRQAINPIMKSTERVKDNLPLVDTGSKEFRYLVHAYNTLYDLNKKNIESLNYDVSHDKLTGVFNRAGFDILNVGLDIHNMAIIEIDGDDFKSVNDTYGHDVGDKILKRIAKSLKYNFRNEDYVIRMGGDEFVVLMQNVNNKQSSLIKEKIRNINKYLSKSDKKTPPISISAGVAFGTNVDDYEVLVKHADEALYKAKNKGKANCVIYGEKNQFA